VPPPHGAWVIEARSLLATRFGPQYGSTTRNPRLNTSNGR